MSVCARCGQVFSSAGVVHYCELVAQANAAMAKGGSFSSEAALSAPSGRGAAGRDAGRDAERLADAPDDGDDAPAREAGSAGATDGLALNDGLDDGHSEKIKVLVRIRPLMAHEHERETSAIVSAVGGTELALNGAEPRHQVRCRFDSVLGPDTSQEGVYSHVRECAEQCARGYNSTIFAYGQTGSGKTHTMFGPPGYYQHGRAGSADDGIVPRAVRALFDTANAMRDESDGGVVEMHVYCSFVQIYNEQLYDMLRDGTRAQPLEIHLDTDGSTYVAGLSEYAVRSASECLEIIRTGEENRAVRETHMNAVSSRSHSLFQVRHACVRARSWSP